MLNYPLDKLLRNLKSLMRYTRNLVLDLLDVIELMKLAATDSLLQYYIQYNMSKESEAQLSNRIRSKSDKPNEPMRGNQSKNSFRLTGQLILDTRIPTRTLEEPLNDEPNSLQNLKNPMGTSKVTKLGEFVQLPSLRFEQHNLLSQQPLFSQEVISPRRTPPKAVYAQKSPLLEERQQNSVIMESHKKLSESGSQKGDAEWNMEKLQMSLDYVQLEEIDSPVPVRHAAKRKLRRQADKQQQERERKEREKDHEREKKERERVKRERERNMEMVSGFLSGKATFMWLFVLGNSVRDQEMGPVREIYKSYIENDYEVPICKGYDEALRFLRIESCFFKVICDLDSCQQVLAESEHNKNIIAIYIYNPEKEKGVGRAFQFKRSSRKVRGMLMDLADAAYIAQEEIQNQAKFIRVGNQLERERNRLRFPGFFILNGVDSTEVTSYRMCLYGSLSLKGHKERALHLKEFTDMVEMRYSNSQAQLRYLDQYSAIDHLSPPDHTKHHEVMAFYVRETFYYALLNAMLRLSRNAEEFRPCAMPFNQTYLAVKHFYKRALGKNERREKFIAYRGAKLRRSDVKALKVGSLIELLGFTSTSLKRQQAQKFMDNDSYLIEIEVQAECSGRTDEQLDYDHGFVDINREGLAAAAFEGQQQVLFNALNVYRVTRLDMESAVRTITLSYGAIVQLVCSKRLLDNIEAAVLQNYRHCVTSFKLIEDDGDALRLAQEHDQCVSYYKTKVDSGEGDAKNLGKLAGAQLQVGDIDAAYDNAVRSLALIQEEYNRSSTSAELSPSYRVPLQLNSRVFYEKQDVLLYEKSTDLYLLAVGRGEWEEQCKVLCVRAEKKLEMGAYGGAISDIKLAHETFQKQTESFDKRRSELKRKYFWSNFCCLCAVRQAQIEEAREFQLLRIQHDQLLFQSQTEATCKLKIRMEIIMKNVNLKIGNQQEYQQYLRRIQEGFKSIAFPPATPVEFAHRQVLQAATVDTQRKFAEYEHLMEEAIENLRAEYPMHPDIADYNEMLGFKRYQAIQQSLSVPKEGAAGQTGSSGRFDYEGHKLMYRKCRDSLMEAAEHLAFHKGVTHRRTMAVNNQLATLDYDFSLLKQAEERVRPGTKLQAGGTEGAQCHVLLAKISLAKGELRRASTHLEKAKCILKEWLVKGMDPEYDRVLMHHPIFLEISMLRAKVYNRQQKHDLALKELHMLQRLVKLQKPFNVALLANLEEEQAEILVCLGETHDFESCVLRSVRLREQAMGRFNIPNAISFSNLFKYLRYTQDFDSALRYHQRSTEIFSRFPPDHPNAWVMHLSNGLIFFNRKQPALALAELEVGLRIAERRYSPSHINFMKIQLQFAKLLKAMGHLERALCLLETLDEIVSRNIRESALASRIENEKDDEKISVRRSVLTEMKELYERSRNEKNIVRTMLGLERCEVNLRECQEFIADSEKIDSLKSLT